MTEDGAVSPILLSHEVRDEPNLQVGIVQELFIVGLLGRGNDLLKQMWPISRVCEFPSVSSLYTQTNSHKQQAPEKWRQSRGQVLQHRATQKNYKCANLG